MRAHLDNADNNALDYLSRVLLCLTPCGISRIDIWVKDRWSASTPMWHTIDDALLSLSNATVSRVHIGAGRDADVPSWRRLPYGCENEFYSQMLPQCTAREVVALCIDDSCKLHSLDRSPLQMRGQLQDLLDILPTWNRPVKDWEITLHSTPMRLGATSQTAWRHRTVWQEISRVFALSITAHPRNVRVEFHLGGLVELVLGVIEGMLFSSCVSILVDLIMSQTTILLSTLCGSNSTTRTTTHWPT